MINISGYKITEKIADGLGTVVYRAQSDRDRKSAILKILKAEYPTLEEITQLRHEYEISRTLDLEGTVRAYGLENYQNGLLLILEDFGGEDLKKFLSHTKLQLIDFLRISLQLVDTLDKLHKKQIIHKDIKPQNIIINPKTLQAKITDFSIASRLTRENQIVSNPNFLEGTLAYMSPEQTGRMNRLIDYRTDFYSLGITFYEMLTGQMPFQSKDLLELVHYHIAKQPVPPKDLNSEIPQVVSEIVMKLLSKMAEDRYQSALGLKVDLEACFAQMQATGKISNFIPGQQDLFSQFIIPQKLYGREEDLVTLMNAFERVSLGNTELMLVSGYSGIGKSSLVNEVHKAIVGAKGYFISGKFDQFKRNIPYASLIQAFQELMRQLLTESAEKLADWKSKLLAAFGNNGQIIIDVIPEIELIVGQQPDVPQLSPTETQNRFNRVFQNFIQVFTKKEHPLVLFLDDLQLADSASLKLIKLLMTSDSQYLLTIGAYRDNEVSPSHRLMITLAEIQKAQVIVNKITLQPLALSNVSQLIADTLHQDIQSSRPLAELVFSKTQGNPFFLTQLLQSLYQEKLLTYEIGVGRWQWDIEQIKNIIINDSNVIEMIANNIQKLPKNTQQVLKFAACIGNQFNLDILAIVNEKSLSETATDLWEALQSGLIIPLSESYKIPLVFGKQKATDSTLNGLKISYKFLHDRVQQAAYSLIAETEKKETHLKIGKLLLKKSNFEERKENIFILVNQLNYGRELISSQIEKDELAQLNLIAGQKAKASTAYEQAAKYLNIALEMIASDSWQHQYELTLALYVAAVEAEYLNTNFEQAAAVSEIILQNTNTLLDTIKVYELQMQFYVAQNQLLKAIDTGLQALEMLKINLYQIINEDSLMIPLPRLEDLENVPIMTDPYDLAAIRLLMAVATPAYNARPDLIPSIVLTLINLCIERGYSSLSAYAYTLYGFLLCASMKDIEAGYLSGQIALKLLEKFNAKELKCKVYDLFYVFISPWKQHIRETIAPLLEGLQSGLETGDIEFVSYCAIAYCNNIFLMGESLEIANQQQTQYSDLLLKLKLEYPINYANIWKQLTLNMLGEAENPGELIGKVFNEAEMLPAFVETNNQTLLFNTYLAKTILFYTFKDRDRAVINASLAAEKADAVVGWITFAIHNFYYSLALLAKYPQVETSQKLEYMKKVEENQQKMQLWADKAPDNYLHKYELIKAEKARVLGQMGEAVECYERAIQGAKEQGYIQEEALANELAAEFYFERNRESIARAYLTDAYYGYIRWGAIAKFRDLESRYPQIFSKVLKRENSGIEVNRTTATTTGSIAGALDLATVMKASQAIAGEIVLSKLIDKLLKIIMENAGAQTSCLILEKNGQLMVEATASVVQDEVAMKNLTLKEASLNLPTSLINYVYRTQESLVLNDAWRTGKFTIDPYIVKYKPKSILCVPIVNKNQIIAIIYLENNLTTGAFTPDRLEILKLLSSQAAISLENAILYGNLEATTDDLKRANAQLEDYSRTLENKVDERTAELRKNNVRLQKALQDLQQTQTQLIQTEKMSSLGQLVAGVAHEINNPINFIYGNIKYVNEYAQNLLKLIDIYQKDYPNPRLEISQYIEDLDLEFLSEDLSKILNSMQVGADRIREIVLSLRNFSRLDESEMKKVDIHTGIDSTLLILQHRFTEKAEGSKIEVIKEYGNLPQVECYAGHLNQVFMNIISNAIDALENFPRSNAGDRTLTGSPTEVAASIWIRTEVSNADWVVIRIADNGPGITEEVKMKLFDPFFTTKPVGSGTGLGLSISYQIIVEKHGGQLKCISTPNQGAEFIIEIPITQQNKGN